MLNWIKEKLHALSKLGQSVPETTPAHSKFENLTFPKGEILAPSTLQLREPTVKYGNVFPLPSPELRVGKFHGVLDREASMKPLVYGVFLYSLLPDSKATVTFAAPSKFDEHTTKNTDFESFDLRLDALLGRKAVLVSWMKEGKQGSILFDPQVRDTERTLLEIFQNIAIKPPQELDSIQLTPENRLAVRALTLELKAREMLENECDGTLSLAASILSQKLIEGLPSHILSNPRNATINPLDDIYTREEIKRILYLVAEETAIQSELIQARDKRGQFAIGQSESFQIPSPECLVAELSRILLKGEYPTLARDLYELPTPRALRNKLHH